VGERGGFTGTGLQLLEKNPRGSKGGVHLRKNVIDIMSLTIGVFVRFFILLFGWFFESG